MGKMKTLNKIFKSVGYFLLVLMFFLILLGGVFLFRYSRWASEVSNEKVNESQIVCTSSLDKEQLQEETEEKVRSFILSDSKTDFVVFSVEETLYSVSSNIEGGQSLEVDDICLEPSEGRWNVYLKYKYSSVGLPWVVMDLVKDKRETAELYVSEVKVGDNEIPKIFRQRVISDINKGISDAVIMLNENRLLGRRIENIELLDDKVVFKGSL
jgi:hypothetical protein